LSHVKIDHTSDLSMFPSNILVACGICALRVAMMGDGPGNELLECEPETKLRERRVWAVLGLVAREAKRRKMVVFMQREDG
jgi:hypothetical protein